MTGQIRIWKGMGMLTLTAAVLAVMLGFGASRALADEPIVGLWLATWSDHGGGPSEGTVIVKAWDVWHEDRTETQNDSGPVNIGFVCQGAWVPVGKRTYFLSHPSFNYAGADGHLDETSSTLIYEKVTVSRDGNSYEGTGSISVFTGIDPFDPSATLIASVPIKVTAKRVVPDGSQLP
jgi:hypothetical protein